jgi:hypothetical protein
MLKLRKPLLSEWRYWPAFPLAALFLVAGIGTASPIPTVPERPIAQSSAKPADKRQNADSDERLADYTLWLTIFTAALAGVGFLQIRLLSNAEKTAREGLRIADRQTALLGEQADILVMQKEIQRLQFFAEHRPRLVLKDVFFSSPDDFGDLTFELTNTGGSDAKITGGFVALNIVNDLRQFKNRTEGDLGSAAGAVLKAGELRQFSRMSPPNVSFCLRFPDARRIKNDDIPDLPDGPLYFFGAILYVDARGEERGIERLSVFRRQWMFGAEHFARSDNPDHEYAD